MVYRKLKGLRSELEYEKKYLIIKPRERLKFKQIQLMLKKKMLERSSEPTAGSLNCFL